MKFVDYLFWYIRIILLMFFIYAFYIHNSQTPIIENQQQQQQNQFDLFSDNPNDKYVNPTKYDRQLPLINRSALKSEIEWATQFLRIPTWSFGYNKCDSEFTEVSCYELYHAAKVIERWENAVKAKTTVGSIFVDVSISISFPDRLSMLYYGFRLSKGRGDDPNSEEASTTRWPPIEVN